MGLFGSDDDDLSKFITGDLSGTKTEQNLKDAFSGEAQARTRYLYFAKQARKDGYVQMQKIFEETSNNESEHGKIWYKLLNGGKMPDTLTNLEAAASTENYEWEDMYARMAIEAREEGFDKIACLFDLVGTVEKMHMTRYNKLIQDIKDKTVFKKEDKIIWECEKCGYTVVCEEAPKICPVCQNPQKFFFEKCFNY